jgi:hypothetical protein
VNPYLCIAVQQGGAIPACGDQQGVYTYPWLTTNNPCLLLVSSRVSMSSFSQQMWLLSNFTAGQQTVSNAHCWSSSKGKPCLQMINCMESMIFSGQHQESVVF